MATFRWACEFGKTKQAVLSVLRQSRPGYCAFHNTKLLQCLSRNSTICNRAGLKSTVVSRKSLHQQRLHNRAPALCAMHNRPDHWCVNQTNAWLLTSSDCRSFHTTRHLWADETSSGNDSDGADSDDEGSSAAEPPQQEIVSEKIYPMRAIASKGIPDVFPEVPLIAISRFPIFPNFVKLVEVSNYFILVSG